ncbi:hypothetical protein LOTGIDRAFT_175368 [Lottia gigantea]|uniref:CCHC-type domain-containing protein n=1 Tax=Lottia gigantea TaxID=225164 RepID=V4ACU6_LOTGI|nr:hypothetical protein LOTGIDRAFT_175368 [Lottia gigantea]ESO94672.1 hypothetical protein LOTGIDRAFT_175368 [Lottia gigantea]
MISTSFPHTDDVCGRESKELGFPSKRTRLGRSHIYLKCFQPGHMRKECPMSRFNPVSTYAHILNKAPQSNSFKTNGFVPASAVAKPPHPPPPPPPITGKVPSNRVDEDGFFTPKQNAKKRTVSQSNISSVSSDSESNIISKKICCSTLFSFEI